MFFTICVVILVANARPLFATVTCGDPGDPKHGRKLDFVFEFPRSINFECNKGYQLVGVKEIFCLPNGDWSSSVPRCEIRKCPQPSPPKDGSVSSNGITYGSVISYSCVKGFSLNGLKERRCLEDGTWSGEEPFCIEQACERPEKPVGGRMVLPSEKITIGTLAIFACDEGTTMIGSKVLKCVEEGIWTFDPPKCLRHCQFLPLANGNFRTKRQYGGYYHGWNPYPNEDEEDTQKHHGEKSFVHCNSNYEFRGLRRISSGHEVTCNDGQWDPEPRCIPAKCRIRPPFIENGNTMVTEGDHGTVVSYYCNRFYILESKGSVMCSYGRWIGNSAVCKDTRCYTRNLSKHNYYVYHEGSLQSGDELQFECNKGYENIINAEIKCHSGEWIGNLRPCKPAKCHNKPPSIENGYTTMTEGDHGTEISYNCNKFYALESVGSIMCSYGSWIGKPAVCKDTRCYKNHLNEDHYTIVYKEYYENKESLQFHCDEGYEKDTNAEIKCDLGKWTGNFQPCKPKKCHLKPSSIENGYTIITEGDHGTPVSYKCNEFYTLNSTGTMKCSYGHWIGTPATCKDSRCYTEDLKQETINILHKGPYLNGNNLTFECNEGYERHANIKCNFGEWTGLLESCRPESKPEDKKDDEMTTITQCPEPDENKWEKKYCELMTSDKDLHVYYQGKLVKNGHCIKDGGDIMLFCLHGKTVNHQLVVKKLICHNGQWNKEIPSCPFDSESNSEESGEVSEERENTHLSPFEDSRENVTEPSFVDASPVLQPDKLVAARRHCEVRKSDDDIKIYHKGNLVKTGDYIPDEERVEFRCTDSEKRQLFGVNKIHCENGKWNYNWFPRCLLKYGTEDLLVFVKTSSHSEVIEDGSNTLYVKPLDKLKFICKNRNSVPVNWETTVQADVNKGMSFSVTEKEIYFIQFNATRLHTGNYTCSNLFGSSVTLQVIVTDLEESVTEQQLSTFCKLGIYDDNLRIFHGVHKIKTGDEVPDGGRILFHCDPIGKSRLYGKNETYCNKGSWMDKVFPTCGFYSCKRVLCSGMYIYTNYQHSGTYTCHIAEENSISIDLVIQNIRCPVIPHSPGLVIKHEHSFVQFSCKDQYELIGAKNATCMETHQWSQNVPVCQPRVCPWAHSGGQGPSRGILMLLDIVFLDLKPISTRNMIIGHKVYHPEKEVARLGYTPAVDCWTSSTDNGPEYCWFTPED
ncbi:sushi, von Willebrand factor type A, EGF and pentraxin domain-containing protein 1-like [Limulus polyphemus]|uniref:Sushi, von Willebrand factor type A, EGF and pentraxin domain-containing protein 1-like n=1 Tax=Limulus polyphemus TaxID=6850 RepID=A0ABM1BM83_LIMPO|nr:sushi, von Willebrand factor type A, EGF and pentraxin domain-containing protein 1-like [Limulus polyphemus]